MEDDAIFVGRECGGIMMGELVKLGSLTISNVDVGSAILIISSYELRDGCLRDVEVVA
jgi:hypothetical protein